MSSRTTGRSGRPWRRRRQYFKQLGLPCSLCGQPIDYELPYRDPVTGVVNPWSFVLDHDTPISRGGDRLDYDNLRPAHDRCNKRKGARVTQGGNPLHTSRRW